MIVPRPPSSFSLRGGLVRATLLLDEQLSVLAEEVHVYLIFWLLELVWADIQQDLVVFNLLTDRIE